MPPRDAQASAASSQPDTGAPAEYSPEERRRLLGVARRAIEAALDRRVLELETPAGGLTEKCACFVTLHLGGVLRGCVGQVVATQPVTHAVAEAAVSAALGDPRFPPLSVGEFPSVEISISVLSPLFPIRPEEVEVGRHGLLVTQGTQRGLLLPQVPLEFGWERETFLGQTCHKAGLPADAWRSGAQLLAFTAESFGEEQDSNSRG